MSNNSCFKKLDRSCVINKLSSYPDNLLIQDLNNIMGSCYNNYYQEEHIFDDHRSNKQDHQRPDHTRPDHTRPEHHDHSRPDHTRPEHDQHNPPDHTRPEHDHPSHQPSNNKNNKEHFNLTTGNFYNNYTNILLIFIFIILFYHIYNNKSTS